MTDKPMPRPRRTAGAPARPRDRRRRVARWIALTLGLLLVLAGAAGGWVYLHLNGNIRHSALFLGTGSPGAERKDGTGQRPMNILVIGSDTRETPADCELGGDCGPGGNADVEMLVHLSSDRGSATVLSIPRDTVVDLPECTDPATGQTYPAQRRVPITGSLQNGGPGCTVAAVHQLTGIPVDHFAMVDFAGVVSLSDAVGGIDVCVGDDVYDPYSHLKLAKGTHTLKGVAALQFLRTRHGFGDGGDLGREAAQHVYLAALVRKLKNAGTLADPAAVYSLADLATRSLTVDDGLGGVSDLISLAYQLDRVPTDRLTFLTMPSVPDPADADRLSPAPEAAAVFRAIADDQPLTAAMAVPSDTAPSAGPLSRPMARPPAGTGNRLFENLTGGATAPTAPPTAADPLNAAAAPGCVAVSTDDTTPFGPPALAYARNPQIPDSAP
ncbi:LCP family protein [Kitasatospora sp. HPMI-4]|uniref:LCP family protein n=1 Tax=Kitasatospora sp. HPMI-4 TaxID=3448443 RepID=UPI003F1CD41C